MKALSGKEVCKLLERHGWSLVRIHSSHHIYTKPGHVESIPVPVHANRAIRKGTLHGILKRAGLTEEDL